MQLKNESTTNALYNPCVLIQNLTKLDVELIDNHLNSSFQLFNAQMPSSLLQSRKDKREIVKSLKNTLPTDFLYYTDHFQLCYLGVGIWDGKNYTNSIIVGPFLSDIPNDSFISTIIEMNNIPIGQRQQIQQYYKTLPILDVSDYKNVGTLIVNIAANPFIESNPIYCKNEENATKNIKDLHSNKNENYYGDVILRYKLEKDIQNAVIKGSREELLKVRNRFHFNPSHRVSNNPLRAQKNMAFVVNTLLRIAAEKGGVSPGYIHTISEKYAILIEKVINLHELDSLIENMQIEYCDLVKKMSTVGYSPMIRKAIDYIHFNFYYKISLNIIADKISVSPSYLSRQFKKETGSTITEYINGKRVEEAKLLIKSNSHSITDIALMVGFDNHNYFSTVFKQITSLTPKEYLMT